MLHLFLKRCITIVKVIEQALYEAPLCLDRETVLRRSKKVTP